MTNSECEEILKNASSGVLAVSGDGGYPYAVPLSFAYADGEIYFHCAKSGHKLDAIKNNPRVSFCVTAQDDVQPAAFTTHYKSVIVFGKAEIIEDEKEIYSAVKLLSEKYSPDYLKESDEEYEKFRKSLCAVKITAEHITGKKAKELL